jgi:hypothetical protein
MNKYLIFLAFLLAPAILPAQNPEDSTSRMEIPTKFFRNFIGTYEAPDSRRRKHPGLADRPLVTIEFDHQKRSVHLIEAHAPGNKFYRVIEGFAFWNPLTGRVEFFANNSESDFLFKGEYSILSDDKIQRKYDVFYPKSHEYYKMGHAILSFRETMTLSENRNILYNKVEYYNKNDDTWLPWSNSALLRLEN